MKKNIFILIIFILTFNLNGQAKRKIDWRTVKVFVFDTQESITNLNGAKIGASGESFFKLKNKPKTIEEINPRRLKKLKKYTADNGAIVVYIDLKGKWDSFTKGKTYYILFLSELTK